MSISPAARRRHRRRNRLQACLLLGGLVAAMAVLGWLLAGVAGLVWVAVMAAAVALARPRVSPAWVLSLYGAEPLPFAAAPDLHRLVGFLAARAGLERAPALHYVRTSMLNAFAVGSRGDAAVAVTDGLLRSLTPRELTGVLAHEVCHVRADDLWIMTLADALGRLTHALAYAGLLLLALGVPLLAEGTATPALFALALALVPTVVTLLQLALSRAREYDADLEAAALTNDLVGLARALGKLERHEGRIWERILVPHRRVPDPLLLRTHPPTAERVRRLLSLVPASGDVPVDSSPFSAPGYPVVTRPPRLRFPGVWR